MILIISAWVTYFLVLQNTAQNTSLILSWDRTYCLSTTSPWWLPVEHPFILPSGT